MIMAYGGTWRWSRVHVVCKELSQLMTLFCAKGHEKYSQLKWNCWPGFELRNFSKEIESYNFLSRFVVTAISGNQLIKKTIEQMQKKLKMWWAKFDVSNRKYAKFK